MRFRGNLYFDGVPPWREVDFVGKTLNIGSAKLKILKMIDRCAATSVAPGAGVSDIDVVQILRRSFGHIDCGVYAQIDRGGRIARGDVAALTG